MTVLRKVAVAAGSLCLASGALLVAAAPSAGSTVTYQNFEATGPVGTTDSTQTSFTLVNPTTGGGVEAAKDSNGNLTINVQPTTKYFAYDASSGQWKPSSFSAVVTPGTTVEAAGRYSQVDGAYNLVANYVWNPPPPASSTPANPKPATVQDYTLQRTFAVTGVATQLGIPLTGTFAWSSNWGFVISTSTNPADFSNDARIQAIAAAHQNQLPITTTDLTKYSLNGAKSDRASTVTAGATLFVGGHYAFGDGDWRFVASYIINGSVPSSIGSMSFTVATTRSDDGVPDGNGGYAGVVYRGQSVAGDGQVNPGPVSFSNVQWSFDPSTVQWVFSGSWQATHNTSDASSVGGTISGTWDPATQALQGVAVLDSTQCTGLFQGLQGGGPFSGTGTADVDNTKPPTLTMNGGFNLSVSHG
jgi:hypothetical protein